MNKNLLITDFDLDGVGPIIILNYIYPDEFDFNVVKDRNYDVAVKEAIQSGKYNQIFLTDGSVKEESTIKMIEKFIDDNNIFFIFDHHQSGIQLNKYPWAFVLPESNGIKNSGTSLFYDYIKILTKTSNKSNLHEKLLKIQKLSYLIQMYDTWTWKEINELKAVDLNNLFWYLERDSFVKDMICKINKSTSDIMEINEFFSEKDEIILDVLDNTCKSYVNKMKNNFFKLKYENAICAVIFSTEHSSILGNVICEENSDIDFCMILNLNEGKAELRSIDGKTDVSKIAVKYGGGGHPRASGFHFKQNEILADNVFKEITKSHLK